MTSINTLTADYQAALNEISASPSQNLNLLSSNLVVFQLGMTAWNNIVDTMNTANLLPTIPLGGGGTFYPFSNTYINEFLAQYKTSNHFPTNTNTFFNDYVTFLQDQTNIAIATQGFSAVTISPQTTQNIINTLEGAFAQDYGILTNITPSSVTVTNPPSGNPPLPNDAADLPASAQTDYAALKSAYTAWFNQYLANYSYPSSGNITQSNFLNAAVSQLSPTAKLLSSSSLVIPTGIGAYAVASNNSSITSFQEVYDTINGSDSGFQAALQSFYNTTIQQKGYFIPSQEISSWAIQVESSTFANFINTDPQFDIGSTLRSIDSKRLLVIDRILDLIALMLGSLQRSAAAQSSRLVILANWQRAYTDSLGQLHTFTKTDGTGISDPNNTVANLDQDKANARDELNTKFNDALRNNMQNQRSVLGDDSQALQANINQSTDEVSQQANLASTLLSDLNSLLTAIFR